jgi:hypothetical protein
MAAGTLFHCEGLHSKSVNAAIKCFCSSRLTENHEIKKQEKAEIGALLLFIGDKFT